MKDKKFELKSKVVDGGYCIGCGVCSYLSNNKIKNEKNELGIYQADNFLCIMETNKNY